MNPRSASTRLAQLFAPAAALLACSGDAVVGSSPDASAADASATDVAVLDAPAPMDAGEPDAPAPMDAPPADNGPACGAAQTLCAGLCVSPASDPSHCGGCGQRCGEGERCEDGRCRASCPASQVACPGGDGGAAVCVLTATDPAHCGACGARCAPGEVCADGACALSCGPRLARCGDRCADLQVDAANCGACGTACAPGQTCAAGRCETTCAQGFTACTGATGFCADLQRDRLNCGACGAACASGEVCDAGACAPSCGAGRAVCAGQCVTLASDPAHCGACENACPARPNAVPVCAAGACAFVCAAGFADCDRDASNGCEVALATDLAHCGACGVRCASTAGTAACAAGRCEVTACAAGRGNCDGDAANGCEVDTATSAAHCGACGNACAAGGSCVAGSCEAVGVSCAAILAARPGIASGVYLLDPDGDGPAAPFRTYCDMTTEGGGWTLLATVTNDGDAANAGNWLVSSPTPNHWESATATFGTPDPSVNADFRSAAFHRVAGRALMITHRNQFLLRTDDACLANVTLRDRLASLDWTCGGSASFASHPPCTNPCVIANSVPRAGDGAMLNGVTRARLYLKAGEADGAQDQNRDRAYLSTSYRDNVDYPTGLGAFCSGSSCSPRTGDADVNNRSDAITPAPGTEFYGVWIR
ncbi:MAG: MXAN_6577-like cysteine-rich protein [Polyangiales bacterium]